MAPAGPASIKGFLFIEVSAFGRGSFLLLRWIPAPSPVSFWSFATSEWFVPSRASAEKGYPAISPNHQGHTALVWSFYSMNEKNLLLSRLLQALLVMQSWLSQPECDGFIMLWKFWNSFTSATQTHLLETGFKMTALLVSGVLLVSVPSG